ncbi:MAG TPA: hypothetical protein VID28_02995 [Methylomirabilota bacterium]|jgi:hypothetical protein
METGVLLVLAALAFTLLVGGIEVWLARHSRREVTRRASVPLHPLSRRPEMPRLRSSSTRRRLRYVGLFVGFLVATYAGLFLLKIVYGVIESWF